ncbi:ABC transporter permease [Macrococcus animalis]|uniref:ABC transporter permease n=1 Tax=Macrococcus animalis TaxID=3395467 RepID=UPI0039BE8477
MVKSVFLKRFIRGLKKNAVQFFSILLMLVLGISIYIGIDSTWRSLSEYKDSAYKSENKADLELQLSNPILVDNTIQSKLNNLNDIKSTETSFLVKSKVDKVSSAELLINAVDEDFSLNRYTITKGTSKLNEKMCVLDATFAKKNNLKVGDLLTLSVKGQKGKFKISGLAKSSSYIYNTPDSTTVIPNHKNYGFIFIGKEDASLFTQKSPVINRVLISAENDTNLQDLKSDVESIFEGNINSFSTVDETLNNLAVTQKIAQYKTIGTLFPIVFFSIVILMSFTTMYRIINNERAIIGIMKSVGVNNSKILRNYILYALVLSIISIIIGVLIGWIIIPNYIWRFFEELFVFNDAKIVLNKNQVFIISVVSIISTCSATIFAFYKLINESPARLLRGKLANSTHQSKKKNKRAKSFFKININLTLVFRQLLNGKIKAITTVIGVIGCTSLLLTALGIRDTISNVAESVYDKTYLYEYKAYLDIGLTQKKLYELEKKYDGELTEEVSLYASSKSISKNSIFHIFTEDSQFMKFHKGNKKIKLAKGDVAVTEKTAEIYELKLNDYIQFRDNKNKTISLKVNKIISLNIGQGVYMTDSTWKELGQKFLPTALVTKDSSIKSDKDKNIIKVIETNKQKSDFMSSMNSTLSMSMLLILAAGLLVTVVLYNLGMLNFSDRERNLATLSVLGFKYHELKIFLSLENIVLTFIGVVIGLPTGVLLHKKIFEKAGMGDELDFTPILANNSFIYTIIFTIVMCIAVSYILNRKIKKIKITEALKSVE